MAPRRHGIGSATFWGLIMLFGFWAWVPALAAPGDLIFERSENAEAGGEAFPPSVFPHWVHRIQFRCYVCHSALFEMRQGANQVTMEKIGEGQFCGACHDGQTAFDVEFDTCTRCHKEPDE